MTKLTLKQQLFCQAYVETLGNATEAVIKAGYDVSKKDGHPDRILAKSIASENLTKPDILQEIQQKLEEAGFNDQNIIKQHLFLINQFADLSVKAKAIDMYYKKIGAYTKVSEEETERNKRLDEFIERAANALP
ncbi:MAG TPA: terminase small subunit [Patescibacteria group bacterium]|nr:terminase small subunit [Patescibacteria group bacterium]